MTLDELTATLDQLRADLEQARQDRDRLRIDHEKLVLEVRNPNVKTLWRVVYEDTATITGTMASGVFETLPWTLHAVYVLSAYAPDSSTPILCVNGTDLVPSDGINVSIQRQRATSPTRTECRLLFHNSGSPAVVAWKVWRRLGLGS
jgi:hypothetical protein